jgi:hypothetical protein
MGQKLDLWFQSDSNYFSLMLEDYPRGCTGHDDETYDFLLHLIKSSETGEVIGFSNEGSDLAEDYIRTMRLLKEKPFPGRYDVPKLGLNDVTLSEIITAIYRRFVLGESTVEYPAAEEREQPLQVVAEEPTDFTAPQSEGVDNPCEG